MQSIEKISQHGLGLLDEFKAFAFRGNMIDLAVGVIIGAAFGKIVDALVKHLFMPIIAIILPGQQSYASWKWVIAGQEIQYGLVLGELLNLIVVALALFIFFVKLMGWLTRRNAEAPPAAPDAQEELLREIRDLLAAQNRKD